MDLDTNGDGIVDQTATHTSGDGAADSLGSTASTGFVGPATGDSGGSMLGPSSSGTSLPSNDGGADEGIYDSRTEDIDGDLLPDLFDQNPTFDQVGTSTSMTPRPRRPQPPGVRLVRW